MKDRVLVTGATGFIGRALTAHLLEDGHRVAVVQRPQSPISDTRCARIEWNGDATSLVGAIMAWKPQTVLHLATHFISQHQAQDVTRLIDANVALGTALLEGARECESTVVITGSAWQHFGGADYHPVSLYAATKQALFDIAVYYESIGVDVRELSFFDTYGPDDDRGKIVSLLLEAAASGQTLDMSSGKQLIDLLYVSDAVDALLTTARLGKPQSIEAARFVARSGSPVTVRELVRVLEEVLKTHIPVNWGGRPDRLNEMRTNWEFGAPPPGWSPKVSLFEGLERCREEKRP